MVTKCVDLREKSVRKILSISITKLVSIQEQMYIFIVVISLRCARMNIHFMAVFPST